MSPSTAGTGPGDKTGYDLNNGPRCLQFDIISVRANELFEVRATFEVCKLECESGDGRAEVNKSGVLSNRWSVVDYIDNNKMTDRTISGRLRVTTPLLSPHHFRGWVVPTLQAGFRRDSVEFTVTEDGLWLQYTIVDKEIAYAAPYPATSWELEHIEKSDTALTMEASVNVVLTGDRDVPRRELFAIAMAIVKAKLYSGFNGKPVTEQISMVDNYGDSNNSVGISCHTLRPRQDDQVLGVGVTKVGIPITAADLALTLAAAYDRNVSGGPFVGNGTFTEGPLPLLGAFHAYLQSPCDETHEFSNSTPPTYGSSPTIVPAYSLSGTIVGSLPSAPTAGISYTHQQNLYTNWQMESIYEENTMRVQVPVAGSAIYSPASGSNSVVVSLGGGITKRIIRCKGTRIGKPPEMPKAVDDYTVAGTSGKAKLLETKWRPHTPTNTVDGQRVYTIEAEYVYAIPSRLWDTAGGVINPISVGYNPWETSSPTEQMTVAATTGAIV